MTSKEMEARSGVPRANIRYYEAEGLLAPARSGNGYRDYSEEDLRTLEKIKLLRRLGVTIEALRALRDGRAELSAVLDRRLAEVGGEQAALGRVERVCGDLRQLCTAGPEQGQYDFAACNPPYFTAGPRSPDPRRAEARHTGSCTTADAVDCARRALRDGGRFLLCQRPEQLAEILAALRAARLEPKRLAFVKNRPDAAPWLFLVEAQKGRKTGLRVEPDILIQSGAALYGPTTL